jgi:DNA-binding response OmpR family regulator
MDDSAFALDLVRTALVDDGVLVSCGRDLADIARLRGEAVDLVVMDVDMPEAFGDDVTSWLLGEGLSAPVYLLSNLPEDQLARRAQDCGARGFISKGIGLDAVVQRIHAILETPKPGRSLAPSLLISDFVSMASGRLRRAEAAVGSGAFSVAASELHTLSGEAGLLGLGELARLAEACRRDAIALVSGQESITATSALRVSLAAVAVELTEAATRARVPMLIAPLTRRTGRLLLLDDSDLYRSTLMGLLEDAGYEVVEVRRLSEARHRIHDGHYDLAILDLQLDDGSGSELIPEIRAHAPRTRLVLLSGQDPTAHNADLMLPKSIDPDELLRQLDELLRKPNTKRMSNA